MTVWINGQADGQVDGFDRGLAYGDGLFATMRVQCGDILFLGVHLARLSVGAKRLGFDWLASDALLSQLKQLAIAHQEACIKLLLTRGVGGRGYGAPEHPSVTEIVSLHPMPEHYAHWQRFGVSLKSAAVQLARQPCLAGIKHLNRLEQVLIKSAPLTPGFDDWLVLDAEGYVIGASMANIFLVKGKQVHTPSMAYCGISGVMREQVIFALIELGFDIDVTPLHYTQLAEFDHGFMTNSLFGIVDINELVLDRLSIADHCGIKSGIMSEADKRDHSNDNKLSCSNPNNPYSEIHVRYTRLGITQQIRQILQLTL